MFLLLSTALFIASASAIQDLTCTSDFKYTEEAVGCRNIMSDKDCNILYPNSTVEAGGTDERPLQCFEGKYGDDEPHDAVDEDLRRTAIKYCPKTCGYCCLEDDYRCPNAEFPRLNCETITPRMCHNPDLKDIIIADCPASCGFCKMGDCVDAAPGCYTQPYICLIRGLEDFVAENCRRTCGLCSSSSSTTSRSEPNGSTDSSSCSDVDPNCDIWIPQGFCSSSLYTDSQKKALCPRSCGMC